MSAKNLDTISSFDDLPLTLAVEDIMKVLGIGRNTAYKLIKSKAIFSIKVGHQIRIPKKSLIDYMTPPA